MESVVYARIAKENVVVVFGDDAHDGYSAPCSLPSFCHFFTSVTTTARPLAARQSEIFFRYTTVTCFPCADRDRSQTQDPFYLLFILKLSYQAIDNFLGARIDPSGIFWVRPGKGDHV